MNPQSTNPLQIALDRINTNPLLAGLPERMSALEMAKALRFHPITPENIKSIDVMDRLRLVGEYKKIFIPTTQTLAIAISLQQMLHEGLTQRDPRQTAAKAFIYTGGQLKGQELCKLEWWPSFASGMVIEGITGMGKSQVVVRFLSLFPQVIKHGANPECGWTSINQLVWLTIHMPSDGSRGGFLENAFRALDSALDTGYTEQYQSTRWTVEKKLAVFLHLLAVHRCGLLVIEEAQERNLSQSLISREFITFFLRLLNWGIPTVLMGNPLAFSKLRDFSQDVDRFSEGGWFHIHPLIDFQTEDWTEDWLPNLWRPTLLDHQDAPYTPVSDDPLDQTLAGFVWKRTAGVPRYVCRLRREVQHAALRTGATQITASMVDEVYRTSEKMIVLHQRIAALINKDWRALRRFGDIPWDYFRCLWNPDSSADSDPDDQPRRSAPKKALAKSSDRGEAVKKPKATKANPIPAAAFSTAEIKAKKFQHAMTTEIAKASGLDNA